MAAEIKDKPLVIKTALDAGGRWLVANHTGTYTDALGAQILNIVKPTIQIIYDTKQVLQGATNNLYILQTADRNDLVPYDTGNRKEN